MATKFFFPSHIVSDFIIKCEQIVVKLMIVLSPPAENLVFPLTTVNAATNDEFSDQAN